MDNQFKAISLSYKNAPIEIRELIALDNEASGKLLGRFRECLGITEALILSTCNRTEVYYSSPTDRFEDIIKLIGVEKNVADIGRFKEYFIRRDRAEAISHLFNVSAGLEAQVVDGHRQQRHGDPLAGGEQDVQLALGGLGGHGGGEVE